MGGIEENVEQKRIRSQIHHFIGIGRYEKIKLLASDLIAGYPEYDYGYIAMAIYENHQGRTENAIELCHKAAEYAMSRFVPGMLLMIYYNIMDDYANADAEYHNLMREYPFCYDAMAIHGYSLWQRGRRDEGIVLLQKAFAENPSDPMTIKYFLTATKKSKDAEMLLKLYMDSQASDKQKLVLTGLHEIYVNNWGEAKKCFEKVLGMDPTDDEALYFMKIIKLRKYLPLLFIAAIGIGAFVYLFMFDPQDLLTSVFFVKPLILLIFIGYIFVKIRSISGNRSKIETKIVNDLDRIIRENDHAGRKLINTPFGGRLHTTGLKINRKI
jgi:tetratricopeptide (TPR) repeat protein